MKKYRDLKSDLNERFANIKFEKGDKADVKILKQIRKDIDGISGNIMWRGFRDNLEDAALVSSFRKEHSWYGMETISKKGHEYYEASKIIRKVMERLKIVDPVFATTDYHKAQNFGFGDTHIMIPKGKYKLWWSPKVHDIVLNVAHGENNKLKKKGGDFRKLKWGSGKSLDEYLADSYKQAPKPYGKNEIIVQTKRYWLVRFWMFKEDELISKQPYNHSTMLADLKTYSDLANLLDEYIERNSQ